MDFGHQPEYKLWSVMVSREKLLDAAIERVSFHTARATYWNEKVDEFRAKLEGSVEIVESIAHDPSSNTYRSTGDRIGRVSVKHDTTAEEMLYAAVNKFNNHVGLLREFEEIRDMVSLASETAAMPVDLETFRKLRMATYSDISLKADMRDEGGM